MRKSGIVVIGIIEILFSLIFLIALDIESKIFLVFPTSINFAFWKGKSFANLIFNFDYIVSFSQILIYEVFSKAFNNYISVSLNNKWKKI